MNFLEISFKCLPVLPNEIAKMLVEFRLVRSFLVELFLEREKTSQQEWSECDVAGIDRREEFVSASDRAATVVRHVDELRLGRVRPCDASKFARFGNPFLAPKEPGLI